jgi:enamine deaminase RidA (YjgF/YER057c/UK114 family)
MRPLGLPSRERSGHGRPSAAGISSSRPKAAPRFGIDLRALVMLTLVAALAVTASPVQQALAQSAGNADVRLVERNITLPAPPAAFANYVGAVQVGNLLFVSGHTSGPQWTPKGKVGKEVTVEQGYQAARQAGLFALATVRATLGSLDRVKRIVKVVGMVNSAQSFSEQPKVVNGFSDLMVDVFGEAIGKHARSAVGVAELPLNSPVEVEMIVEIN